MPKTWAQAQPRVLSFSADTGSLRALAAESDSSVHDFGLYATSKNLAAFNPGSIRRSSFHFGNKKELPKKPATRIISSHRREQEFRKRTFSAPPELPVFDPEQNGDSALLVPQLGHSFWKQLFQTFLNLLTLSPDQE